MGLFSMLEVSGSAMTAERMRAEVSATNMANAETTRTDQGGPYRRKEVVFSSAGIQPFHLLLAHATAGTISPRGMVRVSRVVEDTAPPVRKYEPGHPDADRDGYVSYPAINPIEEMVDLMSASRAYQLNDNAVTASKQMIQQALDILK